MEPSYQRLIFVKQDIASFYAKFSTDIIKKSLLCQKP